MKKGGNDMSTMIETIPRSGQVSTGLMTSTMAIARRGILKFLRTPQLVVLGTIQGAMFLLIFRYVFGGAIAGTGGVDYVDFLVPGFVTTSVLFAGMGAATAIAEDLEAGVVDRMRSLPIPRSAVLTGRAVADTAVLVWSLAITTAIGFAVGFRIHGSVSDAMLAFGLCVVFGFAFEWVFIYLGLIARTAQAAQGMALLVFPLTFVSSAYVPVETMPGWMQAVAEHQPITYMVNAVRALTQGEAAEVLLGHPTGYFVGRSLIWTVAIVAIFVPLAVARYRKG
jgi:ABC-2 type transport system permease protein